ncbi:copper resistance CopC/CopD family protein [Streptomyces sp. NPDC013740]|uniref:copper resistance CopC/CopD family protein n=1 Tax=Streptomyces sp. NPDC013740 TaxID=3364867 RepID=UPI0036F4F306
MTVAVSRAHRWLVVLPAGLALLAAGASPADAHAVLTGSTPARGAVVAEAPQRVVLTFTEEIALSADAVRVLDPAGRRVDDARPVEAGGGSYAVGLRGRLPGGTYTVAYQVVSADSHPVAGAFTFAVGAPSATSAGTVPAVRDPDSGPVGWAYAAARFGAYAGMVLLTGAVCFLLVCRPRGRESRLPHRLVTAGWAVLLACTLALLVLRGAYTGSGRVGDVVDVAAFGEVLGTKAGALLAVRLGLLATGAVMWIRWRRAAAPAGAARAALVAALLLGSALAWTWAGAEHASAGLQTAVAVPVDVLHLLAAGAWIGGLCVLTTALTRSDAVPTEAVARFSRVAFASVCVLVSTGIYQSWRQVGSLPALTETRFGLLLLAKSGGVALLLCLGYASRRWTARLEHGQAPVRHLRRWVAMEAVLGVAVLVVTTVLTTTEPARSELSAAEAGTAAVVSVEASFDSGGPGGRGKTDVVVDPGRAGANAVHVTVTDPSGALLDVPEVQATLTSSAGIGPLPVPLRRASEGHWTVSGFQVPTPGAWELALTVRTSDVDQITLRRPLDVR